MLSATTKGLVELESLRSRVSHDFGKRMMTWEDFQYINQRIEEVMARLIEIATNDRNRLEKDEREAS
jgi:hypothetical protein